MTEIELNEQQRRAVQAQNGNPVDVVDPVTNRRYVLIAQDEYDQVRPLLDKAVLKQVVVPFPGIAPAMLQAQQAFWRDLPDLLKHKSRRRRYVAYCGEQRVGFGRTQTELCQECFRRGLQRGEFYIGLVEEREYPPWGSVPLERSLCECEDTPVPPAAPGSGRAQHDQNP